MAATIRAATEMKKMTTVTAINEIEHGVSHGSVSPMQRSLRRWNTGLFLSAVLGGIVGLGGLTIGFLTFGGHIDSSTSLYTMSTVFIGASFILFGFAAHCLDKVDAADRALRLEYCRQHGLKDEDFEKFKNRK